MAEGSASDGHRILRSVLGDVTNQLGKRKLSEKDKSLTKSNASKDQDRFKQGRVLPRPCTEINSLKGNVISSISKVSNENKARDALDLGNNAAISKNIVEVEDGSKNSSKLGKLTEKNVLMGSSKSNDENKNLNVFYLSGEDAVSKSVVIVGVDNDLADSLSEIDSLKSGTGEMVNANMDHNVVEVIVSDLGDGKNENLNLLEFDKGKGLKSVDADANVEIVNSFANRISAPTGETGVNSMHDGRNCNSGETKVTSEETHSETDFQNYGDDNNVDSFVLSQTGSIDCNVQPESQESILGLERCTELKRGDGCANMSAGIDLIKECSCSFCTKAAYIWLDLHYQDIKARISAIKKSQKEASILAARNYKSRATEKHGVGNSSRASKLESDLMHQWRHLFQHMVDTCEHESNQLEANLLPLTELREQCKTNLEHLNATMSSEKH